MLHHIYISMYLFLCFIVNNNIFVNCHFLQMPVGVIAPPHQNSIDHTMLILHLSRNVYPNNSVSQFQSVNLPSQFQQSHLSHRVLKSQFQQVRKFQTKNMSISDEMCSISAMKIYWWAFGPLLWTFGPVPTAFEIWFPLAILGVVCFLNFQIRYMQPEI